MQFSVLGVPFKCAKDMFTWEKAKWSFFTYLTVGWRGLALALAAIATAVATLLFPTILGVIPDVPLGDDSDFPVILVIKLLLSLGFFVEHYFITSIILMTVFIVFLVLGALYFYYYGIFKKDYKSYDRNYDIPTIPTFKSWSFWWKPYIFIVIIAILLGGVVGAALDFLGSGEILVHTVNTIVGLVLFHIALHGGTWGFVPVRKEAIVTEPTSKS